MAKDVLNKSKLDDNSEKIMRSVLKNEYKQVEVCTTVQNTKLLWMYMIFVVLQTVAVVYMYVGELSNPSDVINSMMSPDALRFMVVSDIVFTLLIYPMIGHHEN